MKRHWSHTIMMKDAAGPCTAAAWISKLNKLLRSWLLN